jgi:DNA-binding HxlR family transcriptional regulator
LANRWSPLILREYFPRKRRFEAFEASLGITRHVLADRLRKLVRFGLLRRIPYQTRADGRCCTSTRTATICLIP